MNLKVIPRKWFETLVERPPDKLLGLNEAQKKSTNPKKVNLSVGAYKDHKGKPQVFPAVRKAQLDIVQTSNNLEYLPQAGLAQYCSTVQKFIFGDLPEKENNRIVTVQTLSGTGALKLAFKFVEDSLQLKNLAFSNPTWTNHEQMAVDHRFNLLHQRQFDKQNNCLDFNGMCSDIHGLPDDTAVMLQPCGHNPTGIDPTQQQWDEVLDIFSKRTSLFPIIDMAQFGFASGDFDMDKQLVSKMFDSKQNFVLCNSFAKNFGMQGERIGSLSVVTDDAEQARIVQTQLKHFVRCLYSSPPINGARIIRRILEDPELTEEWKENLAGVVKRMKGMRKMLKKELEMVGCKPPAGLKSWDHLVDQIGMFCFTGLNEAQCIKLVKDYDIQLTTNGRISVSGLNSDNVTQVAESIKHVEDVK